MYMAITGYVFWASAQARVPFGKLRAGSVPQKSESFRNREAGYSLINSFYE
jgi:hypothetical protein